MVGTVPSVSPCLSNAKVVRQVVSFKLVRVSTGLVRITDTATTHTVSVAAAGRSTPSRPGIRAVIAALPRVRPWTTPFWSMVAMLGLLDANVSGTLPCTCPPATTLTDKGFASATPMVSGLRLTTGAGPAVSSWSRRHETSRGRLKTKTPATRNTATGRRSDETAALTVGTTVIMGVAANVVLRLRHTVATFVTSDGRRRERPALRDALLRPMALAHKLRS